MTQSGEQQAADSQWGAAPCLVCATTPRGFAARCSRAARWWTHPRSTAQARSRPRTARASPPSAARVALERAAQCPHAPQARASHSVLRIRSCPTHRTRAPALEPLLTFTDAPSLPSWPQAQRDQLRARARRRSRRASWRRSLLPARTTSLAFSAATPTRRTGSWCCTGKPLRSTASAALGCKRRKKPQVPARLRWM